MPTIPYSDGRVLAQYDSRGNGTARNPFIFTFTNKITLEGRFELFYATMYVL